MIQSPQSVLAFYQDHNFNPVLIKVENQKIWKQHFAKRRNLCERHLGLPLSLLRGARILEFGPNSGENALVLASYGAKLTLVEPNAQVLPRLYELFRNFDLSAQIESVHCEGIESFHSTDQYDLVIAEGFLYTMTDRDQLLRKITHFVAPGRFGIISLNDRYGGLLEIVRQAYLHHCCRLSNIGDVQSPDSLALAKQLYGEDFARLNASRSFDAWWRDMLVNPFYTDRFLWSFPELFNILLEEDCEFRSSSPVWATFEHYNWYKNVSGRSARYDKLQANWRSCLAYFITGTRVDQTYPQPPAEDVVLALGNLAGDLCLGSWSGAQMPVYPAALDSYLSDHLDSKVRKLNAELKRLVDVLQSDNRQTLLSTYAHATEARSLWGTPYHYLCFERCSV